MNQLPPVPETPAFEKLLTLLVWSALPLSPFICAGCVVVAYLWTNRIP